MNFSFFLILSILFFRDDVADIAPNAIPENVQEKLLKDYEKELSQAKISSKKVSDKEETSSDDWEKLSTGEKSPRKQSKEEVFYMF